MKRNGGVIGGVGHLPDASVICECTEVSLRYQEKLILDDVSMEIRQGEVVSLIGPSGAGKSTLLRVLALLDPPQAGEIFYKGLPVGFNHRIEGRKTKPSEWQLSKERLPIGMVFQSFNLFPHMTVLNNVMIGPLRVLRMDSDSARETAMVQLSRVGMEKFINAFPATLSGGQQQRVAIARALARAPDIMLFDEPTSALDPTLVEEVLQVLTKLAADGMSMIIVTHQLDFVKSVSDRVILMNDGRIIEQGDSNSMFDNSTNPLIRRFMQRTGQ